MTNRNISRDILAAVVESQNHLCVYCNLPFGTIASTRRGDVIQNAVADHWIPWTLGSGSDESNCVAACQLCNSIKSSNVYESVEHASRAILSQRHGKRIRICWIPVTASTDCGESWAREYSGYLAGLLSERDD